MAKVSGRTIGGALALTAFGGVMVYAFIQANAKDTPVVLPEGTQPLSAEQTSTPDGVIGTAGGAESATTQVLANATLESLAISTPPPNEGSCTISNGERVSVGWIGEHTGTMCPADGYLAVPEKDRRNDINGNGEVDIAIIEDFRDPNR